MFFSKTKSILGIDIGTSNIKVAQISHSGQPLLETYGIVNVPYQIGTKNDERVIANMGSILRTLIQRSGATAKRCIISFPNSSVFTSVVELPKMTENELNSAVEFEAKKYIPLTLSEVDLSWSIIANTGQDNMQKVLLTAVPKQVTQNYMKVFELAQLEPEVGEIEALALIRSLIGSVPISCVIIDIGAKSTGLNIIENGFLRLSRNLNVGGDTVTNKIAQSLHISTVRAEQFKKDFGVSGTTFIPETIKPVLDVIKSETKQLLTIYQSHNMQVEKVLLVGGGASLPGIIGYFGDLGVKIELGNPLQAIGYAKEMEPVLKRYALNLPIAIGLALRNE